MLVIDIAYLSTNIDHFTFRRSGDMIAAKQKRDLTNPFSGTICRPWASTCYDLLFTPGQALELKDIVQ